MNYKKSYLKLLMCLLAGAVIGMVSSLFLFFAGKNMIGAAAGFARLWKHTGAVIVGGIAVVTTVTVLGIYRYIRRLWKLEQKAEDEEADVYGEKFERWGQIGITILDCMVGVLLILGCCALPGEKEILSTGGSALLSIIPVMLLSCVLMAVFEVMFYHLMQKRDPRKKGDPASFNFNKKWIEGCDETERLVIYQAGYKAYGYIQLVLMAGILLAMIGNMHFGTGIFPILLCGGIWVIGTVSYGVGKIKGLNCKKAKGR